MSSSKTIAVAVISLSCKIKTLIGRGYSMSSDFCQQYKYGALEILEIHQPKHNINMVL
jgi:hypothetical protein